MDSETAGRESMDRLWIFIIDTDSYAGNFEREMCAYMTGRVGECGVGEEMAERYREDAGVRQGSEPNERIVDMPDDHGCLRPVAIRAMPGTGVCNSVAIFMDRRPTDSEVESMIDRAKRYVAERIGVRECDERIGVIGFRLLLRETIESQVASFPVP